MLQPSPFIPNYRLHVDQTADAIASNVVTTNNLITENLKSDDVANLQSTGVISGGQLSINSGDNTKINITS